MLEVFLESLKDGGPIMLVLTLVCLLTWYSIGERAYRLSGSSLRIFGAEAWTLRSHRIGNKSQQDRRTGEAFLIDVKIKLMVGESLLDACVLAAPLLGLLGTIAGMIDTFEAMAASSALTPADSMSAGISKAMLTTQVGLLVSLPGLLVATALKSKKRRFLRAIESVLSEPHAGHGHGGSVLQHASGSVR